MSETSNQSVPDEPRGEPLAQVDDEDVVTEQEVDLMADAPPTRPYGDAITDEHRRTLEGQGVFVEPATTDTDDEQDDDQKTPEA